MRIALLLIGSALILIACQEKNAEGTISPINWERRAVKHHLSDSLAQGTSYLSIYSEIYSRTEFATFPLTVTVSLRNANPLDSIFIYKAAYYGTDGSEIRTYFQKPIFLKPMETVEIIINEEDQAGGSGANFLFEWAVEPGLVEPIFEAVMISTYGQQGLSFTTHGQRIK